MNKSKNDGLDIFRVQASKMFNVPYDKVTIAQRQKAKIWCFHEVYGMNKKDEKST